MFFIYLLLSFPWNLNMFKLYSHLGATQDMLNGMVHFMTGSHEPFDPSFYERLVTCLNKIEEPRLLEAVDAQWHGFLDYSDTHGTESDPWPVCNNETLVRLTIIVFNL